MALDYQNLENCKAFVEARLDLESDSIEDLETLLGVSAGTKDDETYHRPYLVAALLLGRVAHDDKLLKAKQGVTFDDPAATIRGWYAMQAALDLALGLTIPPGFEVPIVSSASGSTIPRSTSVPTIVTF